VLVRCRRQARLYELGLFVDDIVLYALRRGVRGIANLQEALHRISTYAADWKMEFSANKSAVVHYGNHRSAAALPSFRISGFDLGIQISNFCTIWTRLFRFR